MKNIVFEYKGKSINIECNSNEKMKDIFDKLITKLEIEKKSIYFLYGGKKIEEEEYTYGKIIGNQNNIKIVVCEIDENENIKNKIIESKNVICPKCGENIRMKIENYKIKLYECKNRHEINNILLEEYESMQKIDLSKIKCNDCDKNIADTYNNEFYICLKCNINLCPLCKSKHEKVHDIFINYRQKNYICNKHNEIFFKYCNDCKKNICVRCSAEHKSHNSIYYENILPDIDKIKEVIQELKGVIGIFNNNINNIIKRLNKVKDNMNIYYHIFNHIFKNYEINNRNYEILQNINEINNIKIKEIKDINNDSNINNKIINILKIYNNMINNEINIIYNINKEDEEIKLFDEDFVKNNKNICKLIIDGKESDLIEEYNINNYKKDKLKIKLIGIENVTNMSYMFYNCSSLSNLPDISKWNTNNVTNMSYLFYNCSSLSNLPDISKWNTNNVNNMSYMFSGCSSLSNLPDISKWNTNNVTNMSYMFSECSSLSNLPDISKWNTNNVIDISYMFSECSSLSNLPDIINWNTNNVAFMKDMFKGCKKNLNIPSKFIK